ncbi:MAG: 4-(cytidine 5'-diphospho)-2-C-methyl-D-erythritol kinase [Candidatus Omnitrophica bacterium]|nr:4-(cytidine 5'-diphospho)-2-C-methyl-D-erythritol kinase [Candidatus Omnitrophota bacterium]
MDTIIVKAPAKVNLYLEVLKRRDDGYHDIETIFERIDLCDELTFTKKSEKHGIKLICEGEDIDCSEEENIIVRSAKALTRKDGRKLGVEIRLKKNIPIAAGLGGGSSNAAATLFVVNNLFELGFSRSELMDVGGTVGADVPFFFSYSPFALGTEIGDEITEIKSTLRLWHLIVRPMVKVKSGDIYSRLSLGLTRPRGSAKMLLRIIEKGDMIALAKGLRNRLEDVMLESVKEIQRVKDKILSHGGKGSLVSGSGPATFGIFSTREEAMEAKEKLDRSGWQTFVAGTYEPSLSA